MFAPLMNIWRVPELRHRLAFTFMIIALYRAGSWLPVPGVNTSSLRDFFGGGANGSILSVLNIFSGGALANLSLFALGIMPYITASIIMQLMQTVVPSLEKLSKEGESGYKKITQYTRYLTVALAAFQSAGYVFLFHNGSAIGANDLLPDLTVGPLHPDRDDAHGGHDAAHVDGRADHPARRRQRHLAADLRLDPDGGAAGDRRLAERRHVRAARAADHHARRDPRGRLHERGPAPHPDPVRQAPGRPPDDVGRIDVPAAARQHGGRHPGHLRRRGALLPVDGRASSSPASSRSRRSSPRAAGRRSSSSSR